MLIWAIHIKWWLLWSEHSILNLHYLGFVTWRIVSWQNREIKMWLANRDTSSIRSGMCNLYSTLPHVRVQCASEYKNVMENAEIESTTFRMQSERSTNWANSPFVESARRNAVYKYTQYTTRHSTTYKPSPNIHLSYLVIYYYIVQGAL